MASHLASELAVTGNVGSNSEQPQANNRPFSFQVGTWSQSSIFLGIEGHMDLMGELVQERFAAEVAH